MIENGEMNIARQRREAKEASQVWRQCQHVGLTARQTCSEIGELRRLYMPASRCGEQGEGAAAYESLVAELGHASVSYIS